MSEQQGARPKAPAGWYPHPSMVDTRRYWDGAQWTEHIAPATPAAPQAPARTANRDSLAWVIAVLPMVLAVAYALDREEGAVSALVSLVIFVATVVLAFVDAAKLKRGGSAVGAAAWFTLFAPLAGLIYLTLRTQRAKSTVVLPWVWVLGATALLVAFVTLDVPPYWTPAEV